MGLESFIDIFLNSEYSSSYIKLISIFIFLTFNGFILFPLFFKVRNKYLLLGGGMITGLLVFLLILSIFSYIFKGPGAIAILFILYSLVCIGLFFKHRILFREILKKSGIKIFIETYIFNILIFFINGKELKAVFYILLAAYILLVLSTIFKNRRFLKRILSKDFLPTLIIFLITFIYIILIWLRAGPATMAGDVETYWGIATSFARGNYPIVLPWQPNFLTVYHSGAFIVQGAIHSLTSMSISVVHTSFSAYILSAIFIFVTGLAREKTRSIFSLIPAIFGLIAFGGPLILIGGFSNFLSNFGSAPQFSDIKGSWGAGPTSIDLLYYINYRAFGLAIFFLMIFIIYYLSRRGASFKDLVILIITASLCLSVDETIFIPTVAILLGFILYSLRKFSIGKIIFKSLILLTISIALFFVIQNLFRDSFLTPSPEHPRFKIFKLNSPEFTSAVSYASELRVISKYDGSVWFIPSLFIIMISALILSLLNRSLISAILVITAIVGSIPGFIADNTYVHGGSIRFLNQAYELSMFSLGFLVINLKLLKKSWLSLIVILFILAVFTPQFISSNAKFLHESLAFNFFNYVNGINYRTPVHEWVNNNIPYNEKIIFIDEYPVNLLNSSSTLTGEQYYGFFIPTAPPNYKVLQVDFGTEWFDVVAFLSPQALKELDVKYVFIYYAASQKFSQARIEQLKDPKYFEQIYADKEGILFKVAPLFKQLPEEEMTFRKMTTIIPEGKRVYLDRLHWNEMRRGLILLLSKRTNLYGPEYGQAGDYFGLIETDTPFTAVKDLSQLNDVDYVITETTKGVPKLNNYSFKKAVENPYLTLWEKETK